MHAWHPYYAGYSEAFVESAIDFLDCREDTLVVDPWGGSGTTGAVCARRGVPSLSLDINPVMATFASAKAPEILERRREVMNFFESLSDRLKPSTSDSAEPLLNLFRADTAELIRGYVDLLPATGHAEFSDATSTWDRFSIVRDASLLIDPVYAFLMATAFVCIRDLAGVTKSANPTWLLSAEDKPIIRRDEVVESLCNAAHRMLSELEHFYGSSISFAPTFAMQTDTRRMPIQAETVDRIITSPPYLTRIDYAVSTSPELFLFGGESLLHHVRHETMGAPVITNSPKVQRAEWGMIVNSFLDAVASHDTKAAKSYYWKNLVQYFADMDASLSEIWRIMRRGSAGIVVVQSSYFKEIEAKLGEMYVDMAKIKGFQAKIAYREEVKGHMAHVNTRSNKYKSGKVYFEDFVLIEKP